MGGIPHDKYEPKKGFETWLDKRLPIGRLVFDTLMIPTPKNLNWMWIWGIVVIANKEVMGPNGCSLN